MPEVACDLWATDSMIQGNLVKSWTAMEHVIFPSFNGDVSWKCNPFRVGS